MKSVSNHEKKKKLKISDYNHLIDDVRDYLMQLFKENITCRWKLWVKIINQQTKKLADEWFKGQINKSLKFKKKLSKKEIEQITEFMQHWNGLKISKNQLPESIDQYKEKSKCWANGRRAIQYGRHLYPVMIAHSEKFANKVTQSYFDDLHANNNIKIKLKSLYKNILMYSYLIDLCSRKIKSHFQFKTFYLLCPNSINASETKEVLQKYAVNDSYCYRNRFPAHREQAIDNFEKGRLRATIELKTLLNKYTVKHTPAARIQKQEHAHVDLLRLKNKQMDDVYNSLPNDMGHLFKNIVENGLNYHSQCERKCMNNVVMDTNIGALIDEHSNNVKQFKVMNVAIENINRQNNSNNMSNGNERIQIDGNEYLNVLMFLIGKLVNS